ncbi:hypothetical protein QE152_g39518 [Popillia japonica]|uniref:Uncharacterized protein n=1 Tax=Popillia japonica TaxID=7064 RepID=A0AAW1HTS5_POPJA
MGPPIPHTNLRTSATPPEFCDPHSQSRFTYMWDDAQQVLDAIWPNPTTEPETIDIAAMDCRPLSLRADEGTHLEVAQLNTLLTSRPELFHLRGPPTPVVTHRIDTGNKAPVSSPPYRITPGRQALLDAEVQALLKDGIIEECESAWTSPVVLVPKSDGGIRLCVGYRKREFHPGNHTEASSDSRHSEGRRRAPQPGARTSKGDQRSTPEPSHRLQPRRPRLGHLPYPHQCRQGVFRQTPRDGPYIILGTKGPCSYEVAAQDDPTTPFGVYHSSALKPVPPGQLPETPVVPLRRRGRPRTQTT